MGVTGAASSACSRRQAEMEVNDVSVSASGPLVFSALGYFTIGVASALVSNPIEAPAAQAALRLAALFLGAVVFVVHVWREVVRLKHSRRKAAARSSGGVALGALLLAGYMVLYNMLARSRPFGSTALVLIAWPLFTGALAFVVGTAVAAAINRWQGIREAP